MKDTVIVDHYSEGGKSDCTDIGCYSESTYPRQYLVRVVPSTQSRGSSGICSRLAMLRTYQQYVSVNC